MYPELNIDLARHQMADRLRRAERRALVDRQLDPEGRGHRRLRWRGGRTRRARADQQARP